MYSLWISKLFPSTDSFGICVLVNARCEDVRKACQDSGKAAEAGVVWFDQERFDSQRVKNPFCVTRNISIYRALIYVILILFET